MGQGDRGDYSGALRCPRGGEGDGDLGILWGQGERSHWIHPQNPMNTFIALFTKSWPVAILECQGDIFEAEV